MEERVTQLAREIERAEAETERLRRRLAERPLAPRWRWTFRILAVALVVLFAGSSCVGLNCSRWLRCHPVGVGPNL
jgi:hypothetical protein